MRPAAGSSSLVSSPFSSRRSPGEGRGGDSSYALDDDDDDDRGTHEDVSFLLDGEGAQAEDDGLPWRMNGNEPDTTTSSAALQLVRNIASFMTLSEAASAVSLAGGAGAGAGAGGSSWASSSREDGVGEQREEEDDTDSWAVGAGLDGGAEDASWMSLATPPTPGLVALSPGATPILVASSSAGATPRVRGPASSSASRDPHYPSHHHHTPHPRSHRNWRPSDDDEQEEEDDDDDDEEEGDSVVSLERVLRERRRRWAQEKLASAVFAHPLPLRGFCLDAYRAAQDIRRQQQQQQLLQQQQQPALHHSITDGSGDPETWVEPCKPPAPPASLSSSSRRVRARQNRRLILVHELVDCLFHNVPLSVMLEVADTLGNLSVDTSVASFRITVNVVNGTFSAITFTTRAAFDAVTNFHPLNLLEAIISFQFNAMGKTSEVLVSGIQSVTTGVESASSLALHRLSAANLSLSTAASDGASLMRGGHSKPTTEQQLNRKLLKKMSSINDAARVVAYREHSDDTGGLTRQAMSRTRRMMHYSVSLRPFVATVAYKAPPMPPIATQPPDDDAPALVTLPYRQQSDRSVMSSASDNTSDSQLRGNCNASSPSGSPLICSPQSFPPTPRSRSMVLARGSQFADDVVFLARDRLRIHDGLESHDERTREMAWALKEGKRLAIFDCNHVNGIELTCGQHIATKVGTMHYASTRSMVPVLRNVYVYFEITVMPKFPSDPTVAAASAVQNSPVALSIGLSTLEMPPNTLVGSWQGSVGLCTTGQILIAGQWCSPDDPSVGAYGCGATVGCLVFLDDSSSFETWDGVIVNASVCFSVNGVVVPTPVQQSQDPMGGGGGGGSSGTTSNNSSSHHSALVSPPRPGRAGGEAGDSTDATSYASFASGHHQNLTLTMLVPASEELYPTVTLQTPATAVMCRFSSEDVLLSDSVRVPKGATVYAVDGSVIFGPDTSTAEVR